MAKVFYTGTSKILIRLCEAVNALIDGGGGGGGGEDHYPRYTMTADGHLIVQYSESDTQEAAD